MPAARKTIGKPRRTGVVVNAASSTGARGTRNGLSPERNARAVLELMREMGYAQPAVIGEFNDLR